MVHNLLPVFIPFQIVSAMDIHLYFYILMVCSLPSGQPHYFLDAAAWKRKGKKEGGERDE